MPKVKLYATLKEIVGTDTTFVEGKTVKEVIENLIKKFPSLKKEIVNEDYSLKDDYIYLLNGRNIVFLQNENTPVEENDKVTIFPPVGGG
ncbi:MAG: MoaD/ThiS family protein [Caldisericaceae bacterium]|nr:MoaD/ThiS family protein [Caldisericaceae bacterium]